MCKAMKKHTQKLYAKYRYSAILLRELVATNFKLRYQGSALGYAWSLLKPLFLFAIMYVVFVYFFRIGRGVPHWPVAMLIGIVLWNFFSEVAGGSLKAVVGRGGLMRKINFPKYIIILSGGVSAIINLALNMIIIAIFMVVNNVEITWGLLLAAVFVVQIYIFALGVGFLLSTIYVKFRDIQYIWDVIMQGLFYASGILYPMSRIIEMNETAAKVLLMNPVAQAIQDVRYFAVTQEMPTLRSITDNVFVLLAPFGIVVVTFALGAWYFHKRSPYFAEDA